MSVVLTAVGYPLPPDHRRRSADCWLLTTAGLSILG